MATRIPASQRTREGLRSLIEGRLSTGSAKDDLVKLATRPIVEEPARPSTSPKAMAASQARSRNKNAQRQVSNYRTTRGRYFRSQSYALCALRRVPTNN